MGKQIRNVCTIVFILSLTASSGSAQSKSSPELPNLHKINDRLYRGAQPKRGGAKKLAGMGVKTIINLRGKDATSKAEEAEARAAGLAYFHIPMPDLGRPGDGQMAQVLAVMYKSENWPVFIHCRRGSDRTGMVVALYRMSQEGWTSQQALAEARQHGMSRLQFGMKNYVYGYAWQADGASAFASPGGAAASANGMGSKIEVAMKAAQAATDRMKASLHWLFKRARAVN